MICEQIDSPYQGQMLEVHRIVESHRALFRENQLTRNLCG